MVVGRFKYGEYVLVHWSSMNDSCARRERDTTVVAKALKLQVHGPYASLPRGWVPLTHRPAMSAKSVAFPWTEPVGQRRAPIRRRLHALCLWLSQRDMETTHYIQLKDDMAQTQTARGEWPF